MNIIDMDEEREKETLNREEREEKLKRARKNRRRNSTIKGVFGMLGCMVLLAAAMYGGMSLYEKLSERGGDVPGNDPKQEKEGDGQPGGEGDTVDVLSGSVVYSQAELDQRVAEAVAVAQGEEADKVLNGIKESLSSGTTTVETLRPYYPDDIVVVSDGKFHFVPINRRRKRQSRQVWTDFFPNRSLCPRSKRKFVSFSLEFPGRDRKKRRHRTTVWKDGISSWQRTMRSIRRFCRRY